MIQLYTSHGHHIPFTMLGDDRPEKAERCGGPRLCPQCTREAALHVPALKEAAKPPYQRRGGDVDFILKARTLVYQFVKEGFDQTDRHITFGLDEVYVVWFSKTLQNWKALISTTLPDGMYYEVTYNGDKKVAYIDAYKKFQNVAVPDDDAEIVAEPAKPHVRSA